MPYDKEQGCIYTKLVNVHGKSDPADMMSSRQAILKDMYMNPELVTMMFMPDKKNVHVLLNGKDLIIGEIQGKYDDLLKNRYYKISAWRITGGHEINTGGKTIKANYGINLTIKVYDEILVKNEQKNSKTKALPF